MNKLGQTHIYQQQKFNKTN